MRFPRIEKPRPEEPNGRGPPPRLSNPVSWGRDAVAIRIWFCVI